MNFNKSKIQGNKKAILSISLILMLTMTLKMAFAQPSLAQIGVAQPEKTTGYIDFSPRLVGVGQEATVNLFIYPIPTNYAYQPYYDGYRGITVTFVKPDGTKDTFMPTDGTHVYAAGQTQSLGAIFFYYTPTMAGNWSLSFTMPAQNLTDVSGTVQMSGCTSNTVYFTVQTDTVLAGLLNGYPWSQLPNSNAYWSYPINSNNREWYQISGDWLGETSTSAIVNNPTMRLWQPYGSGPNTAHIVWSQPIRMGGIIGGDYSSISYGAEGSAISSVVLDGKVFVNIEYTNTFECINLATGTVLYKANGQISYGLHLPQNAYRQSGYSSTGNVVLESSYGSTPIAYLFGTSGTAWNYYDPMTGNLVQSITNVSAASYRLIDGSPIAYGITGTVPKQNLVEWNLTRMSVGTTGQPLVTGTNWPDGIVWKIPLPQSQIEGIPSYPLGTGGTNPFAMTLFAISSDASTVVVKASPNQYWGYNAATGASLWNLTLNYPTTANQQIPLYPINDFIVINPTDSTFECYSLLTGAHLWTSTSFSDATWATTWTVYYSSTNDNNNLYSIFPDGTVRAYSLTDGHEIWRSTAIASTEYPNNVVPTVNNMVMVDGKIYVYAGYTSSYKINPISRFAMLVCINATTGDTLFTVNGGIRLSSTADGYVLGTGDNDGNLYCLGKGPTSTTVTAQQQVGGSVLVQGSVLDKSPDSSSATLSAMFANGVPAISDANMSVWMDYLHMQNSTLLNSPPICTGVPVTLTAVDANANVAVIGTATSNYLGNYEFQWTPTTPGLYTVYATFTGSNSYYTSSASTGATVATAAATATPTPTATSAPSNLATTSDLMTYIVVGVIAMIIAIAIVGLVLYRKK